MREIKFRAWLIKDKRIVGVKEMRLGRGGWVKPDEKKDSWWHTGTFNLMQFTGLKDKDGKEIYEGDILTTTELFPNDNAYWEVFWGEMTERGASMWGWMTRTNTGVYMLDNSVRENGKVIGNIYENPELLEIVSS